MNIEKWLYQIRNWKAHWRAFYLGSYITIEGTLAKLFNADADRIIMAGTLDLMIIRANGKRIDLGCVAKRVVTTAGVNYMRDDFNAAAGAADISLFKFHGVGTGTTAEAVGDTALVTECTTALNPDSTRATGTQVGSVSKTYTTVGTLTFDAITAVTEHGIFTTSGTGTGTLWDRSVFTAVAMASGDSLQTTYNLTINDGG